MSFSSVADEFSLKTGLTLLLAPESRRWGILSWGELTSGDAGE
jgi:hypothetical protein